MRITTSTQQVKQWFDSHQRVALPVVVAGSVVLAFILGRFTSAPSRATHTENRRSNEAPAALSNTDRLALSPEQLGRYGLTTVRPELITGMERPITGFVEAAVGARSTIGMPVAGRITRLLVAPGGQVRSGQPVAEVVSPDAAALHADAMAAVATKHSLERQYRLMQPMANQGALSLHEIENRRIASVQAQSDARAAVVKARTIGSPDAAGRFLLRSPMDGQVTAVKTATGAYLQPGDAVAEVSNAQGSEFRFLVSPLLGATLMPDQTLRVKAGSRDYRARITAVAPDGTGSNRTMVVRAQAIDAALPPAGTAVQAFVMVPATARRYSVSAQAIQVLNGAPVVFRYTQGNVSAVPVVVGQPQGGRVTILQGLNGNEILLSGSTGVLNNVLRSARP